MILVKEYIVTTYYWFYNLFYLIIRGNITSKPTMPGVIELIIQEIKQLIQSQKNNHEYIFIDLGCGLGNMLQPMSDVTINGKSLFKKVIGVELDLNMSNQAKLLHKNSKIDIICKDMFNFVREIYGKNNKLSESSVIYIYDPLWNAGLSKDEIDKLYSDCLDCIMRHPGTIIIYCSCDWCREISNHLFIERGIYLKSSYKVSQNGIFNLLRDKYNSLEIWQVP